MKEEDFSEDIKIYYDGSFAAVVKEKGAFDIKKSLQLLNYMEGRGYEFVGITFTAAYFKKEQKSEGRKN